ncbi:hypothetical protein LZC95_15665 [Pendulispora brunnea]|uniref:Cache domain-containing protein n=1 Tax=Pendulispora brunnea TaxID=2905690 RepID=A0ABZ2KHV0_9BACT
MQMLRFALPLGIFLPATLASAPLVLSGCKDQGKYSAQKASEDVASLVQLTNKDVDEVERGMPDGAKKLATLWSPGKTPRDDLAGVRTALTKVRREVPALNLAKSTFFAITDERGVAIRNNLEQDAMAEKNLFGIFPDLAKSKDGPVSTTGAFPETAAQNPPDRDWILAVPIQSDERKLLGVYVTGWAYRRFAFHLQETLRHDLSEKLRKENETGKLPVFYVALFDRTGVYGAPKTPAVDEKALQDADLVTKTASGPHQGVVSITDRDFGYAAARTPKLGPDTGIVVLRSEL